MGKTKIIIIATVLFVTVSGIFYSVNYEKREEAVFIAGQNTEEPLEKTDREPERTGLEEEAGVSLDGEDSPGNQVAEPVKDTIYIHICGQVKVPGVYCVEKESRVTDLIEMAGGFTGQAAKDYINQAQKLSDGQKIYVPSLEEVSDGSLMDTADSVAAQNQASSKVNINTANKAALMNLTGIGEAKAEAIIKYREEHGSFGSIDELKQIDGIKDGVFNKIKDEITV